MSWRADWALGLPLIVLTVVVHVFGLLVIDAKIAWIDTHFADRRGYVGMFVVIVGITSLSVALLHGIEGAIWAIAYRLVGALPDNADAALPPKPDPVPHYHGTSWIGQMQARYKAVTIIPGSSKLLSSTPRPAK